MDKYAIYEAWAPAAGAWSPWVKPAPFAHLPRPLPGPAGLAPPQFDLHWLPTTGERLAVVADLPGTTALYFALHLAGLGWQPVSLLNACSAGRTTQVAAVNKIKIGFIPLDLHFW